MRYRILGSTGVRVSVVGLGTWQFGGEWGRSFSQADADAILDQAAELGINLVDTAECYGDHLSEQLIGDYLSRRDHLGILARVPLASGLLTGKYQPGVSFPANDWRSTVAAGKLRQDLIEAERIRQTEVPAGVPIAQWALAWCLKDPLVSAVIPGCKDVAQVQANAAAAELVTEG